VIDTRALHNRLRRRRRCPHKHESKTIEVPFDLPEKLDELIDWVLTNTAGVDADLVEYLKEQARNTIFGIENKEEE
jgi:hypothetical protein